LGLLAQGLELGQLWALQRDPPRHAEAHRARNAEVGGRAGDGVTGALQIDRDSVLEALFDQVRQFEILEEHVEELFPGQRELERVLAAAVRAAFAAALTLAASRPRDLVAADIFLVARDDMVGAAGAAVVVEDRLRDAA